MFEVGNKVIAIKDHIEGEYKKWQVFKLRGIKEKPCKCKELDLDIGITLRSYEGLMCEACKYLYKKPNGILWCTSTDFAPYDDTLSDIAIEELIEEIEQVVIQY